MTDRPEALVAALAPRYRIEREVGAGGMATVYLARDLKHERDVAIKVLKPELGAVLGVEVPLGNQCCRAPTAPTPPARSCRGPSRESGHEP